MEGRRYTSYYDYANEDDSGGSGPEYDDAQTISFELHSELMEAARKSYCKEIKQLNKDNKSLLNELETMHKLYEQLKKQTENYQMTEEGTSTVKGEEGIVDEEYSISSTDSMVVELEENHDVEIDLSSDFDGHEYESDSVSQDNLIYVIDDATHDGQAISLNIEEVRESDAMLDAEDELDETITITKTEERNLSPNLKLVSLNIQRPELFDCKLCGKELSSYKILRKHYRIVHASSKDHGCTYCPTKFPTADGLKRHMRIHTGQKPYTCTNEGCGRQFNQSGNLSVHKRTCEKRLLRKQMKTKNLALQEKEVVRNQSKQTK